MDLTTVRNRGRLKPRREPYWQKLDAGQYIGFRPSKAGGNGTWIARWYDDTERKNRFHSMGEYGDRRNADRYGAALKDARAWFDHVTGGGIADKPITVREACAMYAKGRPEPAARFRRHVDSDPIAKVTMNKLTRRHVTAWRERVADKPAVVAKRNDGIRTGKRSDASLNRDMAALRAALNMAFNEGYTLTDQPWRAALKPIRGADKGRNIYLDRKERQQLIDNLPEDAATFVRGLCALPLRPGALAGLTAGDFDPRTSTLTIGVDKSGRDRRIQLPEETAKLIDSQRRDKLPAAPLFIRDNGKAWDRFAWRKPIRAAVVAADLPPGTSAYAIRHSTITDLITAGVPSLTVAQISGTSVAMIERHYGHLQQAQATEALSRLVL